MTNRNTLIQGGPSAGIVGMGWVPQSCLVDQPVMPLSHQPKQNQADGGTTKMKINPTQLSEQMVLPVHQPVPSPEMKLPTYLAE